LADALKLTGLNISLSVGSENQQVKVTAAPPALETTNAALGGVIQDQTYENLPLQMSGQQRDPTAFAALLPGLQSGARAPVIGGTANYLAAVYVDGIPVTTINQQGDNRIVSNAIPVEALDQFQVVTSTPGAEYQGGALHPTLNGGFREPRLPACGTSQLLTHTRPQIGQTAPAEGQRTHATFAP